MRWLTAPSPPRRDRPRRSRARRHPVRRHRTERVRLASIPGFGATVPWMTRGSDRPCRDVDPVGEGSPIRPFPRPATRYSASRISPRTRSYPEDAKDKIFDEIDGNAEAAEGAKHSGGAALLVPPHRLARLRHRARRRDHAARRRRRGDAQAGDVAVQRATSHAWSNRTDRVRESRSCSSERIPSRRRDRAPAPRAAERSG